jgi:cyanophycinase
MGFILLEGGAEFGGQMAVPDRLAIQLAGGPDALISILPTAAAPDNNHQRAGQNGVNWFKHLGATNVSSLPLIDNTSANDPVIVEVLSHARLIYLLGGFPRHLAQTLRESRSWQAIFSAHQKGAVIAGSSAGAMALCEYYYDPGSCRVMDGLKLIDGICVLPHHNTFGQTWAARLRKLLPNTILLGIDEETGVICGVSEGLGRVHGKGKITLYHNGLIDKIGPEQEFNLSLLNFSKLP